MASGQALIEIKDVAKSYQVGQQKQQVLFGINLTINHGELVSIMGQSGSGKSTLMNIIGLLDRPDSGEYWFEGSEVSTLSRDQLAYIRNRKVGFVFQSFHLLPRISAVENVGLTLMYQGAKPDVIEEKAMSMLAKVGMADWCRHKPNELSGGQQQRIAIARALVSSPAVILADEPTGALDYDTGRSVLDLFTKLNEDEGSTVIIITHDSQVSEACKRQERMEEGKLVRY